MLAVGSSIAAASWPARTAWLSWWLSSARNGSFVAAFGEVQSHLRLIAPLAVLTTFGLCALLLLDLKACFPRLVSACCFSPFSFVYLTQNSIFCPLSVTVESTFLPLIYFDSCFCYFYLALLSLIDSISASSNKFILMQISIHQFGYFHYFYCFSDSFHSSYWDLENVNAKTSLPLFYQPLRPVHVCY